MSRVYLCAVAAIIGGAMTMPIASAATSPDDSAKKDIFEKCSVKLDGKLVLTEDKFAALVDNLQDSAFAKYDPDCKGKGKNPQGVEMSLTEKKIAKEAAIHDLKDVANTQSRPPGAKGKVILTDVARARFGPAKKLTLPFLVRDAYSTYSLLNPPAPAERASGAQFAYTHDILNSNDIISAHGAIIGWDVLSYKTPADQAASLGFSRIVLAPGFEFDQTRNHADPKKNTDYLGFKFLIEAEKEVPQSPFPLQYFRYSGYLKTDSQGESKIPGMYAEWEPYNLDYAIGVARLIGGGPVQFRWAPILHAEAEKVVDAGSVAGLHTGASYLRAGPIVQANIWFATDGPLQNLVLGAKYYNLWSLAGGTSGHDVHYFEANAAYNLDSSGIAALSIAYREGDLPGNTTRVRDLKTGLTVKY